MQPAFVQGIDDSVIEVVGWAPDERSFAWRGEQVTSRDEAEYSTDVGRATLGRSLSVDGAQHTWVVQVEGEVEGLPGPPDAAGFAAVEAVASRHHRDPGGLRAYYDGVPVPLGADLLFAAPPTGEDTEPPRDDLPRVDGDDAGTLAVTWSRCAARPRIALRTDRWTWTPYAGDPVPGWVSAFRSPSGRWMAVVASIHPYWHMRAGFRPAGGAVALVPTGPETQLLVPPGAAPDTVRALADGLSPDFVVVDVGQALQRRARSVVFAAPGQEEPAKALAARIPGGATVEPLTWEVPQACLVVALGGP